MPDIVIFLIITILFLIVSYWVFPTLITERENALAERRSANIAYNRAVRDQKSAKGSMRSTTADELRTKVRNTRAKLKRTKNEVVHYSVALVFAVSIIIAGYVFALWYFLT
jgi:cell division protein FtsL